MEWMSLDSADKKKKRIKKDNSRKIEAPHRGAIEMDVKSKFRVASGRKRE